MYQCKYFELWELIPPQTFNMYKGERAWQFLDERALRMLDKLREKFGPIIVNDYGFSPSYREKIGRKGKPLDKFSGYRPISCNVGGPDSQHRHGRAFDCDFLEIDTEAVRQYVIDHPKEFKHIHGIELIVPWFHFDTRNYKGLLQFKPKS